MKKLFCLLCAVVLISSCATTNTAPSQTDSIGKIDLPQLGGDTYFVRTSQLDIISTCLSNYEFYEVEEERDFRRVTQRPKLGDLMQELRESAVIKLKVGINPSGAVVLARVLEISSGDTRFAEMVAIKLFSYQYEADPDAPCLQLGTYTLELESLTGRSLR